MAPITSRKNFRRCALLLVFLGQSTTTVSAAGFSPGNNPLGLAGRLPLPSRRGRLAETMSEALDELRETRVELTALRKEMRSIQEIQQQKLVAAASSAGADVPSSAEPTSDKSIDEIEPSAPIERTRRRASPYALGLTPVSG